MERIDDTYRISTGKEFYANRGILGLNIEEDKVFGSYLYDGYDGFNWTDGSKNSLELTQEERKEIADYMINLWKQWGEYSATKPQEGNQ